MTTKSAAHTVSTGTVPIVMSDGPVLVVDVGSASLKAGYAGDDSPVTIIPSVGVKCAKGMEVSLIYLLYSSVYHAILLKLTALNRSWKIPDS